MSFPQDVKPKHLVGGMWRAKQIAHKGKASRTRSSPARLYFAIPPEGGWKGGMEVENGWRPKAGR